MAEVLELVEKRRSRKVAANERVIRLRRLIDDAWRYRKAVERRRRRRRAKRNAISSQAPFVPWLVNVSVRAGAAPDTSGTEPSGDELGRASAGCYSGSTSHDLCVAARSYSSTREKHLHETEKTMHAALVN